MRNFPSCPPFPQDGRGKVRIAGVCAISSPEGEKSLSSSQILVLPRSFKIALLACTNHSSVRKPLVPHDMIAVMGAARVDEIEITPGAHMLDWQNW